MMISRRQFLKYCSIAAGAIGLTATDLMKLEKALAYDGGLPVIWIAGQACTGCTTSLLNTVQYMTAYELLLTGTPTSTLNLKVCDTLTTGMSNEVTQQANLTSSAFALVVEGAIPTDGTGPKVGYCQIGSYAGAASEEVGDVVKMLANHTNCAAILTVGTCSSYGGIPASKPYPTGAQGFLDYMFDASNATYAACRAKTISIPGCPPNPNWIVGTLAFILQDFANGNLTFPNVDNIRRPKTYYGARVCTSCYRNPDAIVNPGTPSKYINPRKGAELGQSPKNGPDLGAFCLRRSGCKGPRTQSDCPTRKWLSPGFGLPGVNWCVGAGAPCQGCVQKGFPDAFMPFLSIS